MDKKAADKKTARLRRGLRTRYKIRELGVCRLCINRTPRHIYAQIIVPAESGDRTLAAASPWSRSCVRRSKAPVMLQRLRRSVRRLPRKPRLLVLPKLLLIVLFSKYHGRVSGIG